MGKYQYNFYDESDEYEVDHYNTKFKKPKRTLEGSKNFSKQKEKTKRKPNNLKQYDRDLLIQDNDM